LHGASRNKKDKEKRANEHGAEKGKEPTTKQPRNTPSRDRVIKGTRQPFKGVPAVSFEKRSDTNTEIIDKANV